ncbi:hypothetical protein BH09MYX1_BH09MYX1_32460 [soil metagenome]
MPLRRDHLPALCAILGETPEFTPDEVVVALEVLEDALTTTGMVALVAEQAGSVMGYACFGDTPMTAGTYDLYWIAVAQTAKRRGIGRALVEAMLDLLRQRSARLIRVETEGGPSYAATRAFYERTGFTFGAEIAHFYAPDRALVVFVKYM